MAIGKQPLQKHTPGKREPLRTLKEFAEEFGVTQNMLTRVLKAKCGPAAVSVSSCWDVKRVYYKPSEMRPWWASVKADVK